MKLSLAGFGDWFASPESSDTTAVFDSSPDADLPRQRSMGKLIDSFLFPLPSGRWALDSRIAETPKSSLGSRIVDFDPINQIGSADSFITERMHSNFAPMRAGFSLAPGGGFATPAAPSATDGVWQGNSPGTHNWSDASKWQSGQIADGPGALANFSVATLSADRNVTIDTPRTIGRMVVGTASGPFHYTFTGMSLTFDNNGNGASLLQSSGSVGETISVPLLLKDDLNVSSASSALFTLSGSISSADTEHSIRVSTSNPVFIPGVISDGAGTINLIKTGGGTLILTGTNTYTGDTSVSGGTLLVYGDQSNATGNVVVSNLGTVLGGAGQIGGDTFILSSSTITGGTTTDVGTLTLNSLSFSSGGAASTYLVNLDGATSDTLVVLGSLHLGIGDAISINGTANGTTTYLLASYDSRSGTFDNEIGIPSGYDLIYGPNELLLVPTAVPEPATWIGAAAGIRRARFPPAAPACWSSARTSQSPLAALTARRNPKTGRSQTAAMAKAGVIH